MIVVTGAAGFIGSCCVARLNAQGRQDLILVDHWDGDDDPKKKNIQGKKFVRFYDKAEFLKLIKRDQLDFDVDCILHMGACSSTVLQDAEYFKVNNFEYSCHVAQWALKVNARLIYASSAATYGDGLQGYDDDEQKISSLKPLNLYGQSKQDFDLWVLANGYQDRMVGLKFFNVFGPNETHKQDMQSVIAKSYHKVATEGKISLFKSYRPEYKDGEQKRDFIYVKDVLDVIDFFISHPTVNGIFNVGTGQARTWNDLAKAIFTAVGKKPVIEYMEMPEVLRGRYQYFTEANMDKLKKVGYAKPFTSLEDAVIDYSHYLKNQERL